MVSRHALIAIAPLAALAACQGGGNVPGDSNDHRPFHEIAQDETVHFTGTEPFWSGQVAAGRLTYTTPESADGTMIPVSRFAGRGGLSFAGEMGGQPLMLVVTPGGCSDGMSDRAFPYIVTLRLGEETRRGCGWTDRQPYTSGQHDGAQQTGSPSRSP